MSEKTIIEINGVKFEMDLRTARRIEEIRIGDRVKVLKKDYAANFSVHPGVVVGFEPFQLLPTIVVAYVDDSFSSADVKFMHFNTKSTDEIIHAADPDFAVDKEAIVARFDRMIATKQREIDEIEAKKRYFQTNFRAFWESVAAPAAAESVE